MCPIVKAFVPAPSLHVSKEELQRFELSGGGTGIHWDELDEDISVEGLLLGTGDRTKATVKKIKP